MKSSIPELYLVEFSRSQKAFHVQTLEEAIRRNLNIMVGHDLDVPDYAVVGAGRTREEAEEVLTYYRKEEVFRPLTESEREYFEGRQENNE